MLATVTQLLIVVAAYVVWRCIQRRARDRQQLRAVRSVNYHVSRVCNYHCEFCFHTAKTSSILKLDEAKRGLRMLRQSGMQKINFAGGEPLLHPRFVGPLAQFCKEELRVKVSLVTNGSRLTDAWMDQFAKYFDVIAVSCDSSVDETNDRIGRRDKVSQREVVRRCASLCRRHGVAFKMNTVVCQYNKDEDMNELLDELQPIRWKVFQVLLIDGENTGDVAQRNAKGLVITADEFQRYIQRHRRQPSLVVEDNAVMRNSYTILDEQMRFLDNSGGSKRPSASILEAGVEGALRNVYFDEKAFIHRKGDFFEAVSHSLADVEDLF